MQFKPSRLDVPGGSIPEIAQYLADRGPFDTKLLAEGDSWFDLFTPLFRGDETNLLGHVRTSRPSVIVDLSRIGDTVADMTTGWQRLQTQIVLDVERWDAWLVSAGGNDLKDAFVAEVANQLSGRRLQMRRGYGSAEIEASTAPATDQAIDAVVQRLDVLIDLRRASSYNRDTPLVLHGYDTITPRNAPAFLFPNLPVRGPWIYPVLEAVGMTPPEMAALARRITARFQQRLKDWAARHPQVHYVDLAGALVPAEFDDVGEVGDWADEIHPSRDGFFKLGQRMNAALHALGL